MNELEIWDEDIYDWFVQKKKIVTFAVQFLHIFEF